MAPNSNLGVNEGYSEGQIAALHRLGTELLEVRSGSRADTICNFACELPLHYVPQRAPPGLELTTFKGALVAEFFSRPTARKCSNVWCKKKEAGFVNIIVSFLGVPFKLVFSSMHVLSLSTASQSLVTLARHIPFLDFI